MKTLIRLFLPRQLVGQVESPTGVLVPKLTGPALSFILDCGVLLFAIGVVAYQVATAHAATYYVSQTPSANDTNTCLLAAPCRTITRGIMVAQSPGDVVLVRAGTYVESVTNWPWSGALDRPITIKAYPGDTVVWTGSYTDFSHRDGALTISAQNGDPRSYIRIEGFRFENNKTRYVIRIHNESRDQDASPMGGFEVVNNTFVNNGNDGIRNGGSVSATVYFQGVGRASFPGPASIVSANRFEGNFSMDILLAGSNDVHVFNNSSTGLQGSQSRYNGYNFLARFVHLGQGSERNLVERNLAYDYTKGSYIKSSLCPADFPRCQFAAAGLRLDTGAHDNTFRYNMVHDLDLADQGSSAGINSESGCNNNRFERNLIFNIGKNGMVDGSFSTNVATGNRWENNTVWNVGQVGMLLANARNAVVKNNLIVDTGKAAIYVTSKSVRAGGLKIHHNDYVVKGEDGPDTKVAVWNGDSYYAKAPQITIQEWASRSSDYGSISEDPLFVNPPQNFHLQTRPVRSPAKWAADDGGDMGAFQ